MRAERWMAVLFAIGSACFLVGPLSPYAELVGPEADGVTFFVGSIFFTAGGAVQTMLAFPGRHLRPAGRAAWLAGSIQSLGTLFFNRTTFRALEVELTSPHYNTLVWRPDALGSICFLVSGAIVYGASPRQGLTPLRSGRGWWEPSVNLLGCVLFGVSAVAGHVVPATGSALDLAASNWTTAAGAACFLACALGTLASGRTHKLLHRRAAAA